MRISLFLFLGYVFSCTANPHHHHKGEHFNKSIRKEPGKTFYVTRSCDFHVMSMQGYHLVVTGHSLGAGVASILALLIKEKKLFSDQMVCYAFSPPGALMR